MELILQNWHIWVPVIVILFPHSALIIKDFGSQIIRCLRRKKGPRSENSTGNDMEMANLQENAPTGMQFNIINKLTINVNAINTIIIMNVTFLLKKLNVFHEQCHNQGIYKLF